jgi:hypothetical protein
MSRRGRHGRHPHPHAPRPWRSSAAAAPARHVSPERPTEAPAPRPAPPVQESTAVNDASPLTSAPAPVAAQGPVLESAPIAPSAVAVERPAPVGPAAVPDAVVHLSPPPGPDNGRGTTCTTAQLRRFIKSRPWIPMHELRRRFGIVGGDDDVTPVRVGDHTLYVGLPAAEGAMVGELLAAGDVGYELSLDPVTPIIVGVYPMRPVPRS